MFRKHRATQSLSSPPNSTSSAAINAARVASNASSSDPRHAGLSVAAAAAALKIHEAPPTNPGDLVTERMLQRRRSTSLTPSTRSRSRTPDPAGSPRLQLARRDSVGSMTERTFRSRSQSPAPGGRDRYRDGADVPPVPSLPHTMHTMADVSNTQKPPLARVAPFRVASQRRKEGDPSWYGGATVGDTGSIRTSDAPLARMSSTASHSPYIRPGSVSPSVNFSYPRSPSARPTSPTEDEQTLVFDPNSRRVVTRAELLADERMSQVLREQDAKRKQQQQPPQPIASQILSRSGSHLARGTMGVGRTRSVSLGQPSRGPAAAAAAAAAILPSTQPTTQPTTAQRPPRSNSNSTTTTARTDPSRPTPSPTPALLSAMPMSPPTQPSLPSHWWTVEHEMQKVLREPSPPPDNDNDDEKPETPVITREPIFADEDDVTLHEDVPDAPEAHELEYDQQVARREALQRLDGLPVKAVHPEGRTAAHSPIELEAQGPTQPSRGVPPSVETPSPIPPEPAQPQTFIREQVPSQPRQQQQQPQPQHQHQQQSNEQTAALAPSRAQREQSLTPEPERARREPSPEPRTETARPHQSPDRRRAAGSRSATGPRQHSDSPVRTARFAPTTEHLTVLHSPPARSASPRKSALKRSSSPMHHMSDDSSEASRDDFGPSRRKTVRVSFDDEAAVVQEAAAPAEPDSPRTSSSHSKIKRWFGLGRSEDPLSPLEEDEAMLQPCPALPLFSSVRDRKNKEPEERALVRPHDASRSAASKQQQQQQQQQHSSPLAGRPESPVSNAAEARRRSEANISKYREPLPSAVQPIERSSLPSSEDDDDDDDSEGFEVPGPIPVLPTGRIESIKEEPEQNHDAASEPERSKQNLGTAQDARTAPVTVPIMAVPTIAVLPATPGQDTVSGPDDFFDLPGQFPGGDAAKPAPISTQSTGTNKNGNSDESDGSSIYSDAYEDLSDMDGDGFMSLDAVLTAPASSAKAPLKKSEREAAVQGVGAAVPPTEPASTDDWEKIKAYWRGLSAEKRKLLEKEAMEEAAADADLEEASKWPKKTKRKKSLEQRISERQVIHQAVHQSTMQQTIMQQTTITPQRDNPERVYQIKPGTAMPIISDNELSIPAGLSSQGGGSTLFKKTMRAGRDSGGLAEPPRETPSPVGGGGGMRRTLRPTSTPIPTPTPEPAGPHPPQRLASSHGHGRHHSTDSSLPSHPPPSQALAAAMLRTMRTRANSDSSEGSLLHHVRPASHTGFRSTMRSGSALSQASTLSHSAPASEDERPPRRFGLGGLSPPGSPSRRRFGTATNADSPGGGGNNNLGGGFKSTLRGGAVESTAGGMSRMKLLGLGGKGGKRGKRSRFTSRLDGSSDDDDADVPMVFRSRFADSSDEDDDGGDGRGRSVLMSSPKRDKRDKRDKKDKKERASLPAGSSLSAHLGWRPLGNKQQQQPQQQPPPQQPQQPQQPQVQWQGQGLRQLPPLQLRVPPHLGDSPDPDSSANEAASPAIRPPNALMDPSRLQRKRLSQHAAAVGPSPSLPSSSTAATITAVDPTLNTIVTTITSDNGNSNGNSNGHRRRSSIMSVLRRKKHDAPGTIHAIERRQGGDTDTELERVPGGTSNLGGGSNPGGGRLVKKHQAEGRRSFSEGDWPLPGPPAAVGQPQQQQQQQQQPPSASHTADHTRDPSDDDDDLLPTPPPLLHPDPPSSEKTTRPFSADGSPPFMAFSPGMAIPQPGFFANHHRSVSYHHDASPVAVEDPVAGGGGGGGGRRKKKFPGLRRMFGLVGE